MVWTMSGGNPKTRNSCARSSVLRRGPLTNSSNWSRASTTNHTADHANIAMLARSSRRSDGRAVVAVRRPHRTGLPQRQQQRRAVGEGAEHVDEQEDDADGGEHEPVPTEDTPGRSAVAAGAGRAATRPDRAAIRRSERSGGRPSHPREWSAYAEAVPIAGARRPDRKAREASILTDMCDEQRREAGCPPGSGIASTWADHYSARVQRAVGRNVRRKDSRAKVTGASRYIDDLRLPGLLLRRHRPVADSARPHHRPAGAAPARSRQRRLSRRARTQPGGAHRRGPAVPGRGRGPPRRRAGAAAGPRRSRERWPPPSPRSRSTTRRSRRSSIRWRRRTPSRTSPSTRATSTQGLARRRRWSSRASTAPATRSSSTSRPTACIAGARRTAGSPCTARCSARTTCTRRWRRCSACDPTAVRVVQTETGGGFGGKEEYPSMHRRATRRCWRARRARRSRWSTTASRTCWRRPSAIRRSSAIAPA